MANRRRVVLAGLAGMIAIAALVLVGIVLRGPDSRNYDARVEAYRRVSDDLHIVVFVTLGYGDSILGYDLREQADTVTVTVRAGHRDLGFKNLVALTGIPVTVTLQDPLRRRAILTAAGAPLPEITCPDGTFGCFVGR